MVKSKQKKSSEGDAQSAATSAKAQKSKRASALYPPTFDPIALELKRAREAAGLSHSDLNRITGISRTVLLGYERGRTKPGAREIRLLSKALKVTPNRLLFGTDEPFDSRASFQHLLAVRKSPGLILASMLPLMPMILSTLTDEETSAILTLIGSIMQSRNKDMYVRITTFAAVMMEHIGDGEGASLAHLNNPEMAAQIEAEIERRIKEAMAASNPSA